MLQSIKATFSNQETEEFSKEIIDLFSRTREGHIGRYCFSSPLFAEDDVRGNEHWSNFIASTKDYYMYHDEVAIISTHAKEIGSVIADAPIFIDLGTGSLTSFEKKVVPIVKKAKPDNFIFVDICRDFADIGKEYLLQKKLVNSASVFIGNFWNELPEANERCAINLQGSTIGNIIVDLRREKTEEGLIRIFKYFFGHLSRKGGYFMFTYDSNQDSNSIFKAYDHPDYHAMEMTILRRVKRDLPTENFNPNDFEHVTEWYPEWHLAAQSVRAKKDITFSICGHSFFVKSGESFRTGSSFKYPDSMITEAAKTEGFKLHKIYTVPNSPMRLAILKAE